MDSSASSHSSLSDTLRYFAQYDYPLTPQELWFWQHGTKFSKSQIPIFKSNFAVRKHRELISQSKWLIAKKVGGQLSKIPFIEAIFVTGSLAMSNCIPSDDIDLMIITSPHTLWVTRLIIFVFLYPVRRRPGVATAPDKICDNLYLDLKNLKLKIKNLYTAHEILQAKCIFDRGGVHRKFLESNSWVKIHLPVAYKHLTLGPSPEFRRGKPQQGGVFWKLIDSTLFVIQYLYMKPKMTTERVGLGFAFFHPDANMGQTA